MLIVDERSDYNGMYGVTHVCNRCEKAFAFGDTRKPPQVRILPSPLHLKKIKLPVDKRQVICYIMGIP